MCEQQKLALITFRLKDDLSQGERDDALICVRALSDIFTLEAAGEVMPDGSLSWTAMAFTDNNGQAIAELIREMPGIRSAEVTAPPAAPQP